MDRKEEQNQERNRQKEIFAGKVAVVTGASRGIGRAIALELARKGAMVVINYNGSEERAQEVQKCIEEEGNEAAIMQCDVSDFQACEAFFKKVIEQFGRLDILVNNAGISQSTSFYNYQPEEFQKIVDLNVTAVFNCSQAAAKIMKEQGGGVILNTSSMVSIYGQPSGCGYPASKFAVNGLTKSLARELGCDNIRVNAVAPGITRTDMVAALPEAVIKPLIATIPLGRVGEPEDIANAFLFLASDMASYVTGEILSVDGAARS